MSTIQPERFEPFEITADGVRQQRPNANDMGRKALPGILLEARRRVNEGAFDHRSYQSDSIVEVGSWAGANAIDMADLGFTVYCVDHWKGGQGDALNFISGALGAKTIFQGFCRNVGHRLQRTIYPCVGQSRTWAEIWPFPVCAVFIDADHSYEACQEDIRLWLPHVLPGGVLFGHDYTLFPSVKQAVDEWVDKTSELGELLVDEEIWARWIPTTD